MLVGGLRWLVCATSDDPWILFAVQSVHAVTVLGLMLGAPLYLEQIVPARLRSTGQAVLAVVGAGVGGMVSTTASGWFLEHLGVDGPYVIGGAGAVLLGLAGRKLLPPPVKLRLPEDEPEPVRASPA